MLFVTFLSFSFFICKTGIVNTYYIELWEVRYNMYKVLSTSVIPQTFSEGKLLHYFYYCFYQVRTEVLKTSYVEGSVDIRRIIKRGTNLWLSSPHLSTQAVRERTCADMGGAFLTKHFWVCSKVQRSKLRLPNLRP